MSMEEGEGREGKMELEEFARAINDAPTMLVIEKFGDTEYVLAKPATYDPVKREVSGYMYRGWMEPGRWRVMTFGENDPREKVFDSRTVLDPVRIQRESVFKVREQGFPVWKIVPYLTEYDFMEPEDMPDWIAILWVKYRETEMEEGKVPEEEMGWLNERIRRLRERIGDEEELLRRAEPPAFRKLREDLERIAKEEASRGGEDDDEEEGDKD